MRKIIITLLLTGSFTLLALTPEPTQEKPFIPPPKTEVQYPNSTTQPVNCFDYYKFGSVYAALETKNYTNISGTKINFFGEIKNENNYPIVNGKLFVKIMRQNDAYDNTGGQDEVDSYVVKENISIKANSSTPITFDWQIPAYALSGEYQASTYFIVDDSFNMSGLSFTTDIVGGVAKFAVQGEQKTTVLFDRTKIQLNNNPYHTVAFTPSVKEDEPANIILILTNTTKETQRVPVTLDLYTWDAQNQKNLLKQDTQTFLINPNSSLEIPYTVTDTAHSVYFLQAKAQYQDTKSEISVRFSRKNKQEPRINFTTLTTYPLEKGKENNLLTCAHNTNTINADYGKVITTIYNYKGKQIHQSQYEAKITGAIQGMNSKFTPQEDHKDLTIETKIYNKAGAIMNESKLTYKCSDFSDDCAEPQFTFGTKTSTNTILTLLGILLLFVILIFTKKHLKNKNIITSLLIILSFGVMMMPGEVEAKVRSWNSGNPISLINSRNYYDEEYNCGSTDMNPYNLQFFVNYYGNLKNVVTGQNLTDGAIVNPGDTLRFIFGKSDIDYSLDYQDVSWIGVGQTADSPYGEWSVDAIPNSANTFNQVNGYCDSNSNDGGTWGTFAVSPPAKTLVNTNNLSCGSLDATHHYIDCTVGNVSATTTITPGINYDSTYGRFYYFLGEDYYDKNNWSSFAGKSNNTVWQPTVSVPIIPFTLTIERCAATNTPPTTPSVTFTPVTVTVGQNTSIAFTSTDTQNNPITYQIDWGDGTVTTETSPTLKSWSTAGTKTIKVRALDDCGQSTWATKTIVVNALPVLDPLTVTADPACGNVVLNWNNNTATSYQVFRKEGTGSYSSISPILTTTTFTDTTITDGHTYTYQIWSGKETISRLSNAISATPTCPCLPPRVINTSDGICHDPITATCSPSPTSTTTGQPITWTATNILGGTGTYTYSWSGTDSLTGTTNPLSKAYTTAGTKNAAVLITSGSQTATISCTAATITATVNYTLTITTAGTGGGTTTGAGTYTAGTPVTATATPNAISNFAGWSGDCNASGQVTMNANKACIATFNLIPITANCSPSPTSANTGQPITWTATNILGGIGTYTYSWSGTDGLTGTTNPLSRTYATAGAKNASVLITSGSQTATISCPAVTVTDDTDVCNNIEDIQTTVPTGLHRDTNGNCVCGSGN